MDQKNVKHNFIHRLSGKKKKKVKTDTAIKRRKLFPLEKLI